MSIALSPLDISGITVAGQQATLTGIPVSAPGVTTQQGKAHLGMYNDSGVGCIAVIQSSNRSLSVPAGSWLAMELDEKDVQVVLTSVYVLPNAGVSKIMATYFFPGETVSSPARLGNSPANISGSVQVSSVSTLSNEGNPAGTLVVDIGPSGLSAITSFWNDHFSISVDQAGTSHTVLQGQSSGNPLLIGKAGDISEVLGNLNIDGTILVLGASSLSGTLGVSGATTLSGGLSSSNAVQTITGNANGSLHIGQAAAGDTIDTTSTDTYLKSPNSTGKVIFQVPNGTEVCHIDSSGITLVAGKDVTLGRRVNYQVGSISHIASFSGTGNGTFDTGLGITPKQITFNPCNINGSSQTIGGTNAQSTVVTTGAGLGWGAVAYHDL